MNSTELVGRITELEESAGGKELKVKLRLCFGDRVVVVDLEPAMVQLKGWGSEENSVALIDLA